MINTKAYKHIQDSEKVLKTLSSEAKNMDNAITRLKELNILIEMLNSFKEMLTEKYYTDYLDTLLLSRMYQTLLSSKNDDVNITEFVYYLDEDLRTGKEFIKNNIIDFLRHKQLKNSLKKNEMFMDDYELWDISIESVLKQVKRKIQWHKRFK